MAQLFSSGRVVDLIIGFMLVEACLVLAHNRRTGRGIGPVELAATLLSGLTLLLALRVALIGGPWPQIAFWLLASLAAHLADLRRRWSR
jgi:hypothetical protein